MLPLALLFYIMNTTSHSSKIMIIISALLLALSSVSCGVMKKDLDDDSGYPTRQRHTTSSVRMNNKGSHNRDWAKNTKPNDDGYHDDRGIDKGSTATNEEWKRLDIKLGRHDNKALYNEIKSWLDRKSVV